MFIIKLHNEAAHRNEHTTSSSPPNAALRPKRAYEKRSFESQGLRYLHPLERRPGRVWGHRYSQVPKPRYRPTQQSSS